MKELTRKQKILIGVVTVIIIVLMAIGIMISGGKDNGEKDKIVVEKDETYTNNGETADSTEEMLDDQARDNSTELDEENTTPRNDQNVTTEPNTGNTGSNSESTTKPSTGSTGSSNTGNQNNSGSNSTGNSNNSGSSNNNSGSNNTGSTNTTTKPSTPVHEHKWIEVTEEKIHYYAWRTICNVCGTDLTDMTSDDRMLHVAMVCGGSYANYFKEVNFVTENIQKETVVTGYKCECGAIKE